MDVKNFRDALFNNNGQDVSALYFGVQFGTYLFLSQWCPKRLFESEAKYEAIDVKMVSVFILMQIKLIFTRKVLRLASF